MQERENRRPSPVPFKVEGEGSPAKQMVHTPVKSARKVLEEDGQRMGGAMGEQRMSGRRSAGEGRVEAVELRTSGKKTMRDVERIFDDQDRMMESVGRSVKRTPSIRDDVDNDDPSRDEERDVEAQKNCTPKKRAPPLPISPEEPTRKKQVEEEVDDTPRVVVPNSRRKCRDVVCLLTLLLTWAAMVSIGIIAFRTGDLESLVFATDFAGRRCGSCADLVVGDDIATHATCNKPFQVIYPEQTNGVFSVCATNCPKANDVLCAHDVAFPDGKKCWTAHTNQKALFFRCVPVPDAKTICLNSARARFFNQSLPANAEDPLCGTCLDPEFESDGLTPTNPSSPKCQSKTIIFSSENTFQKLHPSMQSFALWSEIVNNWLSDLQKSWQPVLLGGGLMSLGFSLLWIMLFALLSQTMVWLTLLGVVVGSGFVAFQLLYAGGIISQQDVESAFKNVGQVVDPDIVAGVKIFKVESTAQMESFTIAGWIMVVVTAILLLLVLYLHSSVFRAASILRNAAWAIMRNRSLIFVPVISFPLIIAIFAWWIFGLALLGSAGRVAPKRFVLELTGENLTQPGDAAERNDLIPAMIVVHTFGALWSMFFVRAFFSTVTASVVASWKYEKGSVTRKLSLGGSLYRIIRFHIGSVALGSGLVAFLQLLRWILDYVDRRTRTLGQKRSVLVSSVFAVAKCLLTCFAVALKFATRFAYIIIAVRGEPFCTATKTAFLLLASNVLDSATALFLSWAVLFLGRLLVVGGSAACTWIVIDQRLTAGFESMLPSSFTSMQVSSVLIPVMSSCVLSWFVSGAVFDLYGSALDTLILCKCEERIANPASNRRSKREETSRLTLV